MIRRIKDTALSKGLRAAINRQIKEYGHMLKLDLDSQKKSISVQLMLEGEKEVLDIEVGRYELSEENGKYTLRLYNIRTSRSWMNTVAASYLEGRAFNIPSEYAKLLKVVV